MPTFIIENIDRKSPGGRDFRFRGRRRGSCRLRPRDELDPLPDGLQEHRCFELGRCLVDFVMSRDVAAIKIIDENSSRIGA